MKRSPIQATNPCDQPLHRAPARVRLLATIIVVLTSLWYVAFTFGFRDGGKGFGQFSDFWVAKFCLGAPLIYLALVPIMARLYAREFPQHPVIFWFALCFGSTPLLLIFFIIMRALAQMAEA